MAEFGLGMRSESGQQLYNLFRYSFDQCPNLLPRRPISCLAEASLGIRICDTYLEGAKGCGYTSLSSSIIRRTIPFQAYPILTTTTLPYHYSSRDMATKFGRKVAFITGCSEPASLGAAFALDLYSRGWRVFVSARKIQTLTGLESAGCEVGGMSSLREGGCVLGKTRLIDSQAVQLDVVDQESIDEAVHTVSELTDGRLDLLINNVSGHLMLLTRADLRGALVQ